MQTDAIKKTWDDKFMELASHISDWSKDRSTKIGCVIIGPDREIRSTGYNGMPRGVMDELGQRHIRPIKYLWFEHAERNAIYNAARMGTPLKGCTLYVRWFPCADCARAIIQSGIVEVICEKPETNAEALARWHTNLCVVPEMLAEAGVRLRYYEYTETRV